MSVMKNFLAGFTIFFLMRFGSSEKIGSGCQFCHQIVEQIQKQTPLEPTLALLESISYQYCSRKHLYPPHVCIGAIKAMSPFILESSWKHFTDPHTICHKVHLCSPEYKIRNLTEDIQRIIQDKPDRKWQVPTKQKILKVMHLSDVHPDMYYTAGAPADCDQPVCCRENTTEIIDLREQWERAVRGQPRQVAPTSHQPAGYWGSIASCQLPLQTFNLFLQELKTLDVDLILWTGDNTPHDIWAQSQSYNLNYSLLLTQRLKQATNATILPTIGNHESWPVNVYDFEGQREYVFKEALASAWRSWIGDDAFNMFKQNGFYKIHHPKMPNLKIISLNTQAGNDKNWFLLRNPTDPGHMLEWLQKELLESEQLEEHVWIIGHISPKSSLNDWAMRYNALVDRFQYVIRGQFFGHSHVDHISFYPSFKNSGMLSGFFMIAPSLTTATFKNPNYRIMDIDEDTMQVLDYDQYMLNLSTNPTKDDHPKFQLLYQFTKAYNLTDLTIHGGITDLYHKLQKQPQYQKIYSYLMYGGLHPGKSGRGIFCDTTTSPEFKAKCEGHELKKDWFDNIAGPWKDRTS